MSTTPERIGGFEIVARLGHRGLVEIILGRAPDGTAGLVRLERLATSSAGDARLRAAFLDAARSAAAIDHPNLTRTLGISEADGALVVVREHVEGADAAALVAGALRAGERISAAVAARIVERAARGLEHAHAFRDAAGSALVHGGLAPRSIVAGLDGRVKVQDLGVSSARALRGPLANLEADVVYRAPEQARKGIADARCDVFSLGMVLYALLRLGTPHGGPEGTALIGSVAASAMAAALADLSDVPGPVAAVLRRALAMEPAERFPVAGELADALERAARASGGAGDREIAALAARYAGAVGDEEPEEATRRMPTFAAPDLGGPPADTAGDGPTAKRGAPPAQASLATARGVAGAAFAAPVVRDDGTPSAGDSGPTPPSRPTPTARTLLPGDRVARYVIEGHLGRGGTADVYQAHDSVLGRKVALKLLKSAEDARARERLVREAQAVATFQHPNSVVLFDVGEADGTPYIAMELVPGRPLGAYVGDPSIPRERRLRWLVAVARALGAAHRVGIVHRDVKPSNVMIRDDGEVKVLDFGIARREKSWGPNGGTGTLTRQGAVLGTLRYAAPEQLRSEPVDGRADQFAFAMTAYELLAGRPPWPEARAVDLAMRILVDHPPPLASVAPDLPSSVAQAIDRALAKAPADRFATIDELADALEPFAEVITRTTMTLVGAPAAPGFTNATALPGAPGGRPSATSPTPGGSALPPPAPRLRAHERALVAFSGVSVVLLLVLVVVVVVRARSQPAGAGADAAAVPSAPLVVEALSCKPATVEGGGDGELAKAIGVGACARLAIELGVEWGVPGATPVEVRARLDGGAASVALSVGGRELRGAGPTPAEAIGAAVATASGALTRPALGPREIAQWGAADEAGARRIARAWRRRAARMSSNVAVEVQHLLETDRESPVPHVLAVLAGAGTSDAARVAREQALGRLERLPAPRAHMLRGALLAFPVPTDLAEAVRLMRTSYAEAPDDADMIALYASQAVRMGLPEGFQVVDRLYAAAPTRALPALEAAALLAPDRDVPRAGRYAGSSIETLPETRASLLVDQLLAADRLADAKAAVELGRALGLGGAAGEPLEYDGARIHVALEAGDTKQARDLARTLLGDPRPSAQLEGAFATAGSYVAEGHVADALAVLAREAERLQSLGGADGPAALLTESLRLRRWLGQEAPAASVARLEAVLAMPGEIAPASRAEALAEVALTATGKEAAKARATALQRIDELGARAGGDSAARDATLLCAVALVRAQDGERAAGDLWHRHQTAPFAALQRAAVDAGLALEASGDAAGAARAYRIAETPNDVDREQAQRLVAAARLAALAADEGAAARKAWLERIWQTADPDVRKTLEAAPAPAASGASKPSPKAPARGPKKTHAR
jgi:serine/threonine-protein kinase